MTTVTQRTEDHCEVSEVPAYMDCLGSPESEDLL